MLRALISFFLSLALCALTLCGAVLPKGDADPVQTAFRPHGGADPWYYEHEGTFYYCYTYGNGVGVKVSDRPETLNDKEHHLVYEAPEGTEFSCEFWAPELHFLDGKWYIYVAADDGENRNHRMIVLESDAPTGPFTLRGKISDPSDKWAIDGTVAEIGGNLCFIWSGWESNEDGRQNLYIAPMRDPCTISSERVLLSQPTKRWEKKGMPINEGPEVLQIDGRVYVVYSASGSWTDDYCLGLLTFLGGDPLDPRAWVKCPVPVFSKRSGAFGPGHASFLLDGETGRRYIVYHANVESGSGWGGRSVRMQEFRTVFGVPVFGRPLLPDAGAPEEK